jgi:hypothetical protein
VALGGPIVAGLLAGCSPALDWREVRPAGTAVVATLPCKPNASSRTVQLAGHPVRLSMLACKADGTTWALAAADVAEPARVGPALQALRESTRANLQGEVVEAAAVVVRGATPHEAQARVRVGGRKQDGSPASAQFIVFSHGTQVFQAIALGGRWPEPAAETFFESLRVGS